MAATRQAAALCWRMDTRWRQGAIFAAGIALGGVLAAAYLLLQRDDAGEAPAAVTAPAAVAQASRPAPASGGCGFEPVVQKTSAKDGRVALAAPGTTVAEVRAAVVQGKEAMASSRDRDAEVAFINACRAAARAGPGSVDVADAKYQLARHYAALAQEGAAAREELLRRARPLYEDSLRIYLAGLGNGHEKTRFAAEGLASLRQESARAPARVARTPAPPAVARKEAPVAPPQAMGAARAPEIVAQPQPSFDCDKAQSTPEKLICADAELARLDRDLGELYSRARRLASDAEAFQRVSDREWRRRESECTDRDCLLRWYAQRRQQLQEQVEAARDEVSLAR